MARQSQSSGSERGSVDIDDPRRARVFGFASQLKRAARAWLFAARGARFTLSKAPAGAMMAHNHRESGVCRLRWLRAGPISSSVIDRIGVMLFRPTSLANAG